MSDLKTVRSVSDEARLARRQLAETRIDRIQKANKKLRTAMVYLCRLHLSLSDVENGDSLITEAIIILGKDKP